MLRRRGKVTAMPITLPTTADPALILHGDCIEVMSRIESESIDSIVCDPPYNLAFMGKKWDDKGEGKSFQNWCESWATEALRVLKPGGHLLAFGGTRTYHRLACGIEDAGFEVRDSIHWIYGSGFPKSQNVSKMIDKMAGAKREVVGTKVGLPGYSLTDNPGEGVAMSGNVDGSLRNPVAECEITAPATPAAVQWDGWGTAIKPAHEPIVVARKPFKGTVVANVLEHGVGALNIDGTRIGNSTRTNSSGPSVEQNGFVKGFVGGTETEQHNFGRWPANLILSHDEDCVEVGMRKAKTSEAVEENGVTSNGVTVVESYAPGTKNVPHADADGTETTPAYECVPGCPVAELDRQSGIRHGFKAQNFNRPGASYSKSIFIGVGSGSDHIPQAYNDIGGASMFFYKAKASKKDRNYGMPDGEKNIHPTVKPIALIQYLCRLVTPPGGIVLTPFNGSGTTGIASIREGFRFVGIDNNEDYIEIATNRIVQSIIDSRKVGVA